MPYRRKGEGKWTGAVWIRGRKMTRRCLTKREAREWEQNQQRLEKSCERIATGYSLASWSNDYLDYAKRFCVKTYKEKQAVFKNLFQSVNPLQLVTAFKEDAALTYFGKEASRLVQRSKRAKPFKRSGHAVNKDRKNLVAAWNWGIRYKAMPKLNPFQVDKLPEQRHPRYIPPESDFWAVYAVAEGQDKVMLLTHLHTAARRGEIYRLHREDVDFSRCMIRLWTKKRKDGTLEPDWLPMTGELHDALLLHCQQVKSGWVFPNPKDGEPYASRSRWMKALCKKAGVRPFEVHAIRHLTASILAQAGTPLPQIQAILRHRKLTTTELYIHSLGGPNEALQVLERRGNVVTIGKSFVPIPVPVGKR